MIESEIIMDHSGNLGNDMIGNDMLGNDMLGNDREQ